jgi:hypothetical protein
MDWQDGHNGISNALRGSLIVYNGIYQWVEQVIVNARACLRLDEAPSAAEGCEW